MAALAFARDKSHIEKHAQFSSVGIVNPSKIESLYRPVSEAVSRELSLTTGQRLRGTESRSMEWNNDTLVKVRGFEISRKNVLHCYVPTEPGVCDGSFCPDVIVFIKRFMADERGAGAAAPMPGGIVVVSWDYVKIKMLYVIWDNRRCCAMAWGEVVDRALFTKSGVNAGEISSLFTKEVQRVLEKSRAK